MESRRVIFVAQLTMVLSYWKNPVAFKLNCLNMMKEKAGYFYKFIFGQIDPTADLNKQTTVFGTSQSSIKRVLFGMMAELSSIKHHFWAEFQCDGPKRRALRNKKGIHMDLPWICTPSIVAKKFWRDNTWHVHCSFQTHFSHSWRPTCPIQT